MPPGTGPGPGSASWIHPERMRRMRAEDHVELEEERGQPVLLFEIARRVLDRRPQPEELAEIARHVRRDAAVIEAVVVDEVRPVVARADVPPPVELVLRPRQ